MNFNWEVVIKKLIGKKGTSLIEVLVAGSLLAVVTAGLLLTINTIYTTKSTIQVNEALKLQQEKLIEILNSRNAWIYTINNNSITCLSGSSASCTAGTYEVAIYDGSNVKITDISTNNLGYTSTMALCDYTQANCEMRYIVSWSPICESTTSCFSPLINFSGQLQVKDSIKLQLPDPSIYNFNFIRGTFTANAQVNCQSLGGTFVVGTNTCNLPSNNQTCPSGQIVVGINSTGAIVCQALMNDSCGAGEYAKGVNPDGTLLCFPLAGNCPTTPPTGYNPDPSVGFTIGVGVDPGDRGDCGGDKTDCGPK